MNVRLLKRLRREVKRNLVLLKANNPDMISHPFAVKIYGYVELFMWEHEAIDWFNTERHTIMAMILRRERNKRRKNNVRD